MAKLPCLVVVVQDGEATRRYRGTTRQDWENQTGWANKLQSDGWGTNRSPWVEKWRHLRVSFTLTTTVCGVTLQRHTRSPNVWFRFVAIRWPLVHSLSKIFVFKLIMWPRMHSRSQFSLLPAFVCVLDDVWSPVMTASRDALVRFSTARILSC